MRKSTVSSHLSRGRPSPSGVKGLPLLGARSLLHGRIPGLRCTHLKPRMTLGLTRTTPELEAPGDRSSCYQLRPKALLPFSLYYPFLFALIFSKFLPVLLCSFNLQKQQKNFSFLLLSLTFEKPRKISFLSLVCFVFRVQLES